MSTILAGVAALGVMGAAIAYVRSRPKTTGNGQPLKPRMPSASEAVKQQMRELITREFLAAGLSERAAKAAITNAVAESGLDPLAVGDGGHSAGLFQIHDLNGRRFTIGDISRLNPLVNTRWILENEVLAASGKRFRAADASGAGVDELAAIFAYDIERPADKAGEAQRRAELARKLYPADVG